MLIWSLNKGSLFFFSSPSPLQILDSELPVMEPYFVQKPDLSESGPGLRVTWLGHATVLVEIDGLNVLTDPIFSQRASPVQFMGPKRYRGPPCTVEQVEYRTFHQNIWPSSKFCDYFYTACFLSTAAQDRCSGHQPLSLWPPGCWFCFQSERPLRRDATLVRLLCTFTVSLD